MPPPPAALVVPPGPPPPVMVVVVPPSVLVTRPVETPRKRWPALVAQDVGIGDVQIDARDGDVVVVLERQRDGVGKAQIDLAVAQQVVQRGVFVEPRQRIIRWRVGQATGWRSEAS